MQLGAAQRGDAWGRENLRDPEQQHGFTVKIASILAGAVLLIAGWSGACAQEPPPVEFTVDGFVIEGDSPLDGSVSEAALKPFLGVYSGLEGLLAAADALESELRKRGYTFYRVTLPPQTLDSGTVVLKVVRFKLADVEIQGNSNFSAENIAASLPLLRAGEVPNTRELSRSLTVANIHPRKHLRVNFANSEKVQDALIARVRVTDQRPWQLFASFNNIGTDDSGNTRMSIGAQYGNLFHRDHIITGTYTTSPDNADDVKQFGVHYQLPVYVWKGWFSAFYVHSDVDVGNVAEVFDVSGAGDFVGFSFFRPLLRFGNYTHSLTVGIQDRLFDTDIFESATGGFVDAISTNVRSRPINVRYDGSYLWSQTSLSFYVDFVRNLPGGGGNNDKRYAKLSPEAPPDDAWMLMRFGANLSRELPHGFLGIANLSGQYSGETLIPGEQFGLGGERSIRGFEERTVSGDSGLQLNLEVWSPPFRQLPGLRFLAFVDVGHKIIEEPVDPQRRSDTLSSAGVGARFQWKDQLIVSVDYGHTLAEASGEEASDPGNVKTHFNIQYRF